MTNEQKSPYTKKFVKNIDNLYVYTKSENKFINKGNGFLSVEYAEIDGKKVGVIVCRNTMGKSLIEGFLNPQVKKFEIYVKNFKHVAWFYFLSLNKEGKYEIGQAKVPVRRRIFIFSL